MRSTQHGLTQRVVHYATTVVLLFSCTTEQAAEQSPDRATLGGGNGAASICQRTAQGEAGDLALARCLAGSRTWSHDWLPAV